jgi:dipeptidyl aminopeptidase/acylaminoacyl peptidase
MNIKRFFLIPALMFGIVACQSLEKTSETSTSAGAEKMSNSTKTTAPFGSWKSPISAVMLTEAGIGMSDLRTYKGTVFWRESRPKEKGRQVLMQRDGGGVIKQWTGEEFNVRTRVHEYGGNAYVLFDGGVVFANFADQRLYWQASVDAKPIVLTPAGYQYADGFLDAANNRLIFIREDHRAETKRENGEERNQIVAIPIPSENAKENAGDVLVTGADFYAYPRVNAKGNEIAWVQWDHPNMPWDDAQLMKAPLVSGKAHAIEPVVSAQNRSPTEPSYSSADQLYFVDDPNGWWNLSHKKPGASTEIIAPIEREFSGPLWNVGLTSYVFIDAKTALVRTSFGAIDALSVLDIDQQTYKKLALPFVSIGEIQPLSPSKALALVQSERDTAQLIEINLIDQSFTVVHQPSARPVSVDWIAAPKAIEFPTKDGPDGEARTAHAWFYPPTNPNASGPANKSPPLIVTIHGGPTSVSKPILNLSRQYWTSRGFALVDVNYGGSTSYGRAYRQRLNGQWGIVDVQDAIAAVDYLVANKLVDPAQVAIRGGSAGGFTTLAALAFHDRFKAGANLYGVADIKALAATSHKFERHYDVSLVGPPNGALYRARSPLFNLEGFSEPLITLQGSEDKVVPPAQSQAIVAALDQRKVPHAYIEFAGEQHGFRQAENIIRAQEAELYFYGQIFGFRPADAIEAVEIKHWLVHD